MRLKHGKDYGGVADVRASRVGFLTPPAPSIEPVLVSEEMVMDYVTLRGIENKLGVKKEDIPSYVLHELIDNALDYIEATLSKESTPEINVYITTSDEAIHLKVSNPDTEQTFTNQVIENMFNYHNYSSTKRNQFKISRGALGHGLKTVLGSVYALATEHYNLTSWTPLKLRNGNKEWTIGLTVDRITGLQPPDFKSTVVNDILKTEIEIDIPVDSDSIDKNVNELIQIFNKYLILNPHITMNLSLNDKYNHYPQVQKIKPDWKNLHSIWTYSKKDFEYLISTIKGDGLILYDAMCNEKVENLKHVKGVKDVPKERIVIAKELKKAVTDNPDYQDFINKLEELVESLPTAI
jgi:hypothetical protein